MTKRGFTLIELLIALTILAVIAAIVYASFSSIINSTDDARINSTALRLQDFLSQSFTTNLTCVYADEELQQEVFNFVGVDEEGPHGPADKLRFCSSAPLAGAPAMPGDIKEVQYEVLSETDEGSNLNLGGVSEGNQQAVTVPLDAAAYRMLQALETPLLGANVQEIDNESGNFVPDESYQSPSWSVPVRSMNIRYFDGIDWVDQWDSVEMGRLPWCVEVKINFARTEAQVEAESAQEFDPETDADLTLEIPIPVAIGTTEQSRYSEAYDNEAERVMDGDNNNDGTQNSSSKPDKKQ